MCQSRVYYIRQIIVLVTGSQLIHAQLSIRQWWVASGCRKQLSIREEQAIIQVLVSRSSSYSIVILKDLKHCVMSKAAAQLELGTSVNNDSLRQGVCGAI